MAVSDEAKEQSAESEKQDGDGRVTDAETAFEEYAGDKECPECGEPIIDVRANCPNCGYEYKDSDYEDKEAGSEFLAGSAVDDEGNENPEDETGTGEQDEAEGDSEESGSDKGSDDE